MSDNCTIMTINDKQIYIIGTAHISSDSAYEAYELIKEVRPDCVCVELDNDRIHSITHPEEWKNTNLSKVIKEKKSSFLLANIVLSSYQKRLAKQFDISAGQEMLDSMKAAGEVGAKVVGIDRNLKTTFMRIWRNLNFREKMKLLFTGIYSFLSDETITEEELEELKTKDMLESALSELSASFPSLKKYLVDERDMYLAQKIKNCEADTAVAVVGAAHVAGILAHINEDVQTDSLDEIPPPSIIGKILGWSIPAIILIMFAVTFFYDANASLEQIKKWVLYNGSFAAIGTLLAGGHILSIVTSLIAAPFTALHPLLAVGWFSGLVEVKMTKPTVGDFGNLGEDLAKMSGLWKNKITRAFLVVFFANLGATIGTFVSGFQIFGIFKDIF